MLQANGRDLRRHRAGFSIVDKEPHPRRILDASPGDQIAEWRHKSAMCAEVLVPYMSGAELYY